MSIWARWTYRNIKAFQMLLKYSPGSICLINSYHTVFLFNVIKLFSLNFHTLSWLNFYKNYNTASHLTTVTNVILEAEKRQQRIYIYLFPLITMLHVDQITRTQIDLTFCIFACTVHTDYIPQTHLNCKEYLYRTLFLNSFLLSFNES